MLGRFRAIEVHFGLINLLYVLCVGTFHKIAASPLSLVNAPQALVIPPRLTSLNVTSGPSLKKGWPDEFPFYVPIETADPGDNCALDFPIVGDRLGTPAENHFFLLEILEQLTKYKAQPAGSSAKAFDLSRHDVRFKMEPVPQHSAGLDQVTAALKIMYNIVKDSEVREFVALVVCQNMAKARFRTWLSDSETELDWNLAPNASSFRKRILS